MRPGSLKSGRAAPGADEARGEKKGRGRVTHVSEERAIEAPADVVWRIVADSARWPEFFRTHDLRGRLTTVATDGETKRRLHFEPGWDWEEERGRVRVGEEIEWKATRPPQGFASYLTLIELVPGRGFTTLRFDVWFKQSKLFGRGARAKMVEDTVLTALIEIDRLAMKDLASRAPSDAIPR